MHHSSRPPSLEKTSRVRILDNEAGSSTRKGRADEPSSPEDGDNFRKSLQIDMKGLVGDAVGNMSISPASRDVVLAARRGLFIIDLESPLQVPRFLPQGGTWDVADVQWNPHPSRAEYIVSTSSEKLLIWNLLMPGKTSIEHILRSHYRAITDINWHTTERDTVVSVGIDSWVWAWDLRQPRKPIFGLSAFNSAGTHVKWNRQDPNILASAHANQVFIWDRRKGSLPISKIQAHTSKIYGIDWSHQAADEIVTCSLDRTIKVWDVNTLSDSDSKPQLIISTSYPVWRARNLPFGRGVLSLAQRGETALEMYSHSSPKSPVEIFEGHTDVVKEFVWRKDGRETEFQLITWSKDRTLRFWPVDTDAMQRVGHVPPTVVRGRQSRSSSSPTISYRNPPQAIDDGPLFSAPIGNRSILAEVRAAHPPTTPLPMAKGLQSAPSPDLAPKEESFGSRPIRMHSLLKSGTMSRGNAGGKSLSRVDALSWLSSVKVGEGRRGSSSGQGSAGDHSADASRISSRSRGASEPRLNSTTARKRSESRVRASDEKKEENQSLQDEITSVLNKLASTAKIKLEKHDLMKKRTCTLGLHGPWGEHSLVFLRVTFSFPRDYPLPQGTPSVELERNPLISIKTRASILRHLRVIRETQRPCLEACLRFLLSGPDDKGAASLPLDSESSSEDEDVNLRKPRDYTVSMLRSNKNLTEPRTSQGCFGPNGDLVCFFRAPPRIVRNVLHGTSESSPVKMSETPRSDETEDKTYQPPSLLSDAVRRLSLAALDRLQKAESRRSADAEHMFRTMTNLLTFSQNRFSRDSRSNSNSIGDAPPKGYSLVAPRRCTVFITHTSIIDATQADKRVAVGYIFQGPHISLADVCIQNATVAGECGRYDHERVFLILAALFPASKDRDNIRSGFSKVERDTIIQLHRHFSSNKDIQMLAMLSMLVLQVSHHLHTLAAKDLLTWATSKSSTSKVASSLDYFSLSRGPVPPTTGGIPWRFPTNTPPLLSLGAGPTLSSSNSSRGSWSSLFNSGSMRQFMSNVQDNIRDGLTTPLEMPVSPPKGGIPVPQSGAAKSVRVQNVPESPVKSLIRRTGSGSASPQYFSPTSSRSFTELAIPETLLPGQRPPSRRNTAVAVLDRRPVLTAKTNAGNSTPPSRTRGKKTIVFEEPEPEKDTQVFNSSQLSQFTAHVHAYAELLFSWQLYHKRLEILKAIAAPAQMGEERKEHEIAIILKCPNCSSVLPEKAQKGSNACQECSFPRILAPACSICRLPARGLSQSCTKCLHIIHLSCWRSLGRATEFCPSGCGCHCSVHFSRGSQRFNVL